MAMKDCPRCKGTGDDSGHDCYQCHGRGRVRDFVFGKTYTRKTWEVVRTRTVIERVFVEGLEMSRRDAILTAEDVFEGPHKMYVQHEYPRTRITAKVVGTSAEVY